MPNQVTAIFLVTGVVFGSVVLGSHLAAARLPGNQQGYEPAQPIAFSHRLHAGELKVSCFYCHTGAERGAVAGIPSTSVCMNCHKGVTAPLRSVRDEEAAAKAEGRAPRPVVSPELRKLYDAVGLDEALAPGGTSRPVEWRRVHNLPAFVKFDHRAHVGSGVECRVCHGPVESMERVRQEERLSMGWCVNCHRETGRTGVAMKAVKPPLDCAACHN
jgi:hypothetical protein